MILGIDEVGRGPWAGPLVVGAVVLPDISNIEGLTDSKKLSIKRRRELDEVIRKEALGWGLGWVHAEELDEVGLSRALRLATIRAVEAVNTPYHEIIIDGTINFLKETNKGQFVTTMAKADYLIPAVSAASIIAKVARDAYMEKQGEVYPAYGFASHVGYGTAKHQQALVEYGVTSLHRKSFAPIKKLLGASANSVQKDSVALTSKVLGNEAEEKAAKWLLSQGFTISERNWKTKYCEIDCIARKNGILYFVEVKYRTSSKQGGGVAAITPKKLEQMRFAAELYMTRNTKLNLQPRLAVLALSQEGIETLLEVV